MGRFARTLLFVFCLSSFLCHSDHLFSVASRQLSLSCFPFLVSADTHGFVGLLRPVSLVNICVVFSGTDSKKGGQSWNGNHHRHQVSARPGHSLPGHVQHQHRRRHQRRRRVPMKPPPPGGSKTLRSPRSTAGSAAGESSRESVHHKRQTQPALSQYREVERSEQSTERVAKAKSAKMSATHTRHNYVGSIACGPSLARIRIILL